MRKIIAIIIILFSIIHLYASENTSPDKKICGVYITGIGCPNCAVTDPIILRETLEKNPDLVLIEYEVYHLKKINREIAINYFSSWLPDESPAVPSLIFTKEKKAVGKHEVLSLEKDIGSFKNTHFPKPDGSVESFASLDITKLPGKVSIWYKNRLLSGDGEGNSDELKAILFSEDIKEALKKIPHKMTEPVGGEVSEQVLPFTNAAQVKGWLFQWNENSSGGKGELHRDAEKTMVKEKPNNAGAASTTNAGTFFALKIMLALIAVMLLMLFVLYLFDRHNMIKAGTLSGLTEKQKNSIVIFGALIFLAIFFVGAKSISTGFIEEMGYELPLPIFTFLIAIVDGFNPCNMFVLTFLLALLVSVSHSRLRIYTVGYIFVFVVYIIYFLFMVAWLNIFKYIGFIAPLRIAIAAIALIAGFINCKELIFFKKGISLTTSDKGAAFLQKKARGMKDVIKNGTMPVLILSSITLAAFASLIELPCTAGFPIIYTSILSGMDISNSSLLYYFWIALYNLFYIIPLAVIIGVFGYTFKGKAISEKTVQRIKFIGGFIMLILGITLLVNPGLIGIGM